MDIHYHVSTLDMSEPYLFFYCGKSLPGLGGRPFTVAGCMAVWLLEGDDFPLQLHTAIVSFPGGADIHIPDEIVDDLSFYKFPKAQTLLDIGARYFPTATLVSFVNMSLIVEFPEQSHASCRESLANISAGITTSNVSIEYHFGELAPRDQALDPGSTDGVSDRVDCEAQGSWLWPNTMLTSNTEYSVSAGILVQKNAEKRLTVPFHCSDEEYVNSGSSENSEKPDHFKCSSNSRNTKIGYLTDRVGNTDIGLAKLLPKITFSNRILGGETTAKTLLRSD